ncbi:tRNA (guanosine(37)-N1)-methyltransferase TrmD [bacterium]|nr:tRNA (guanosine(37)-N1)-methyltransferase TrmD [bacterium]
MMIFDIITIFPGLFENVFNDSILGSAQKSGLINVQIRHFRDFGEGRHKTVDDSPFGGGPGMVLKPGPLVSCIREIRKDGPIGPVIGLSPQGIPLRQTVVEELSRFDRLVLVCGRYEGFDERILPEFDLEISIGDYVLTGGEFAAMILVDSISRMIPGVVGKIDSVEQDSFFGGLLDYPHYTRPYEWENQRVPQVLMEGNHEKIRKWRRGKAILRTAIRRPDIFAKTSTSQIDRDLFQSVLGED